jgi:hypothetical protein
MKIEFTDQNGAKYSFAVEGPNKENVSKLMDFIDSISTKATTSNHNLENTTPVADTNFNKVFGLVSNKFRFGSFTSSDVLEAYEDHFKLHSTLSTISTYLSRLSERGLLTRSRNGAGWVYKLVKQQEVSTITPATSAANATAPNNNDDQTNEELTKLPLGPYITGQ